MYGSLMRSMTVFYPTMQPLCCSLSLITCSGDGDLYHLFRLFSLNCSDLWLVVENHCG